MDKLSSADDIEILRESILKINPRKNISILSIKELDNPQYEEKMKKLESELDKIKRLLKTIN